MLIKNFHQAIVVILGATVLSGCSSFTMSNADPLARETLSALIDDFNRFKTEQRDLQKAVGTLSLRVNALEPTTKTFTADKTEDVLSSTMTDIVQPELSSEDRLLAPLNGSPIDFRPFAATVSVKSVHVRSEPVLADNVLSVAFRGYEFLVIGEAEHYWQTESGWIYKKALNLKEI